MQWGDKLEFLEKFEATSGTAPPALQERPVLDKDLEEFARAFFVLGSSRQASFGGICGISLTEINAYITIYGEPLYGVEIFVHLIKLMDQTFMSELRAKNGRNS